MARWSDVNEPDDPLRADDPLVGAQHEDVLLGSGAADDDDPAAEYADAGHEDADESPESVAVLDDRPTTKLPPVVAAAPAAEPQGRWSGAAPWAVFAAVAVVVITATTTLASWLQGPTAERQSFTGLIQPPPTSAVAPVAPAEPAPPPPTAEPEPQPEANPDPDPAPAARPTERPRPTRAQPAAPPPAAAVNAPASRTPKPEEPPAATSAPQAPAAAEADTAERDTAEKDGEQESADADKAKPDEDSDE